MILGIDPTISVNNLAPAQELIFNVTITSKIPGDFRLSFATTQVTTVADQLTQASLSIDNVNVLDTTGSFLFAVTNRFDNKNYEFN